MLTSIPDIVFQNAVLTTVITVIVLAAVNWQKGLTYSEYRLAHLIKCRLFLALEALPESVTLPKSLPGPLAELEVPLNPRKNGRPLVRTASDEDYVRTIDATPGEIARQISAEFSPHLVATAKRRETQDGHQWAHSQWVFFHGDGADDDDQTEAYLFANPDGTADVYAHVETAVTDPEGHVTDEQHHGDYRNAFATVWEAADGD